MRDVVSPPGWLGGHARQKATHMDMGHKSWQDVYREQPVTAFGFCREQDSKQPQPAHHPQPVLFRRLARIPVRRATMAMDPSLLHWEVVNDRATTFYERFAAAWNSHSDALTESDGDVKWVSLAALLLGMVLAAVVLYLYAAVTKCACATLRRTGCYLQCPVVVVVAPEADFMPYLRTGQPANRFSASRGRSPAPRARATHSQWNAMRAALGPHVPDKDIYNLVQKHGDDTASAIGDFFGSQHR